MTDCPEDIRQVSGSFIAGSLYKPVAEVFGRFPEVSGGFWRIPDNMSLTDHKVLYK